MEISGFKNSIIRWVYKVVKEALKKSKKKSRSVLLGNSKYSRSGSQIEEGIVQTLFNNWRNHPYINLQLYFELHKIHLSDSEAKNGGFLGGQCRAVRKRGNARPYSQSRKKSEETRCKKQGNARPYSQSRKKK